MFLNLFNDLCPYMGECPVQGSCKKEDCTILQLFRERNAAEKKLRKIKAFVDKSCMMNDCAEKPTCSGCNCISDDQAIKRIAKILDEV